MVNRLPLSLPGGHAWRSCGSGGWQATGTRDHHNGDDRRGERKQRHEQGAAELCRGDDRVADACGEYGGLRPEQAVTPCVTPAMPPPAMIAVVHFSIGETSAITAADTMVPATKAAGVASVSSRLSTPGM